MTRPRRPGDQLPPIPGEGTDVQTLVIDDLRERREFGYQRYGVGVYPFNGREALIDLYHELMDALVYTKQLMEEEQIVMMEDDVEFRSDMTVELVQSMATDASVVASARVSTQGEQSLLTQTLGTRENGLIRFLMKNLHGTPFEHNSMTFFIQAPIFVFREMMRHRIGFSFNEESGRYRELQPVFYLAADERPLIQVGKPGSYEFELGSESQWQLTNTAGRRIARISYAAYRQQLEGGIAREVARMVLPVSIYSSAYVTVNARSLMHFLSLRTRRESSTFPSFPQRELEMVAEAMEALWSKLMPLTHAAFENNGRVAP